jgi:hypothetical protein
MSTALRAHADSVHCGAEPSGAGVVPVVQDLESRYTSAPDGNRRAVHCVLTQFAAVEHRVAGLPGPDHFQQTGEHVGRFIVPRAGLLP